MWNPTLVVIGFLAAMIFVNALDRFFFPEDWEKKKDSSGKDVARTKRRDW